MSHSYCLEESTIRVSYPTSPYQRKVSSAHRVWFFKDEDRNKYVSFGKKDAIYQLNCVFDALVEDIQFIKNADHALSQREYESARRLFDVFVLLHQFVHKNDDWT